MSLTGRFSTLFLTALAVVLVGFASTLYIAAHVYLHRQVADRIETALDVLAAAAEIHPDGVEWEPSERVLPLGRGDEPDRLRWAVFDPQGRRVDRSVNLDDADLGKEWTPERSDRPHPSRLTDRSGRSWLVAGRRLQPGGSTASGSLVASGRISPPVMDPPVLFYPTLDLRAYAPLGPVEATLRALAWLLLAAGAGSWLGAALLCRRISRRALAPLRRLVESARRLHAAEPGWALPAAGTGDELDELGQEFNALLVRLHQSYQQQRAFSGHASHQLRTPLTVLVGQVEVALRRDRPAEEYRRVLGMVLTRAVQLGRIIEALLFLAQAEGDPALPGLECLDLGSWATAYLAEAGELARAVRRDAAREPLPIWGEATLLGQLLDNLLDNAAKHGGPGGSVIVATYRASDRAVLAVQDAGPGIPAAEVAAVFDPFYRTSNTRAGGPAGSGLGLAVVDRIARSLGGDARVVPSGGGCRIEVRLPIRTEDNSGPAGSTPNSP